MLSAAPIRAPTIPASNVARARKFDEHLWTYAQGGIRGGRDRRMRDHRSVHVPHEQRGDIQGQPGVPGRSTTSKLRWPSSRRGASCSSSTKAMVR